MKIVLDANQFVSAVLVPWGQPAQIMALWRQNLIQVVVSPPIMAEVRRVLLYPRLQQRHGWSEEQVDQFLDNAQAAAIVTPGLLAVDSVPGDPTDDKYLTCAAEGEAEYIVTGDQHLLRLTTWRGIRVMSPSQFLAAFPT